MSLSRRFQLATVNFGDDLDLLWLLVIAAGMVVLVVPILGFVFLTTVAAVYLAHRGHFATPPAHDDRQDTHDR